MIPVIDCHDGSHRVESIVLIQKVFLYFSLEAERTLKLKPIYCPKQFLLNKEIEKLQIEKDQTDDELAYKEKVFQVRMEHPKY